MNTARSAVLAALLAVAFAGGAAFAQDDYGSPDSDIRQTVARLAYISGDVSFARGDDPDEWQPADANIPMTLGDRVWTADGRLELQVHGGNVIRLANGTDLAALNLTEDTQAVLAVRGDRVVPDPAARRRRRLRGRHAQRRHHVRANRRLSDRRARERRHPLAGAARPRHRRLGRRSGPARRRRRDPDRGAGAAAVRHGRRRGARRLGPLGRRARRALRQRALLPVRFRRHRGSRGPRPVTDAGNRYRTTDGAGRRSRWPSAGSRTGSAAGSGRTRGDGPGSRPSRGAGRRTTTAAG